MSVTFSGGKGPISAQRLAQAERSMGVTFPKDYREFMLLHNGGEPSKADFVFSKSRSPYADGRVRRFYSIDDAGALDVESTYKILSAVAPPRIPRDVIAIGSDSFGNQICLGVVGARCEHVYFWDHENEDEDEPTYGNMHLIATAFAEFLSKLT